MSYETLSDSRYAGCERFLDVREGANNTMFFGRRDRFVYRDHINNRYHIVSEGETYAVIAAQYFAHVYEAARMWWVVCDYQPIPIIDPTVKPAGGTVLIIPPNELLLDITDRNPYVLSKE